MIRHEADWARDRLDADYTARKCCSVEAFEATIDAYAGQSALARETLPCRANLLFDDVTGQRLDLLAADPSSLRPLMVFVHGGYWRALSKEHSTFAAPMLAAHGIATAAPDYRLAPAASIADIVHDVRKSVAWLWHNAPDLGIDRSRIVVAGSSAGGHLTGALAAPDWPAQYGLPVHPLRGALPISGLFELAPLAAMTVQDWMGFTPEQIADCSPLRHLPASGMKLGVAVAEQETAGFHRQSAAYAQATGAPLLQVAGRHHFDVILDLCEADSDLSRMLLWLF